VTLAPVSYYAPEEVSSPRFAYAFAKGCRGMITNELDLFDGPVALFGSPSRWPVLRQAQLEGRDWYYGDHGYFGRRRYFRITKNRYQHDGLWTSTPPSHRFQAFGRNVVPWKKEGRHVLVCPNSEIYCRLHGFDVRSWINMVELTVRGHSDREVRTRWKTTQYPIAYDLKDCWAVVVFSSAAALDALIAGIPVFVLAPWAAGARMGLSDLTQIETPFYPTDREPFLWALANQQWTLQEILDGHAWRVLNGVN
jgi:hypothetical protein